MDKNVTPDDSTYPLFQIHPTVSSEPYSQNISIEVSFLVPGGSLPMFWKIGGIIKPFSDNDIKLCAAFSFFFLLEIKWNYLSQMKLFMQFN